MPYPTTTVEIAFNNGPYDASPTWIDVTSDVREVTTRRGRADEYQNFEAGTATVVLDNRARKYDPINTAGTYYGKLLPKKQIRISATTSSAFVVFQGYIKGWPVSMTNAGYDSTVTIECYDALGLLAAEEMPNDIADKYIRSLSPRHYWPLTDPIDPANFATTQLQDFGSNPRPLTAPVTTIRTANASGLAVGLPDTCVSLSETEFIEGWYFVTPPAAATAQTIVEWFQIASGDANFIFLQYGIGHEVDAYFDKTTSILYVGTYNGTQNKVYSATVYLDEFQPHHIGIVTTSTGVLTACYIDGIAETLTLTATNPWTDPLTENYATTPGRHQQAATWSSALTATQIQTIYRLGLGNITETTTNRFNRIIDYTSYPPLKTTTGTTVATVSEISIGGPSITSELQLLADSEGGNLYVSKDGTITMTGRFDFATGTSLTSQATFGGAGIGIGTELDYAIDSENMRNDLAMGISGDSTVEVRDATSVAAYGTSGGSWPTQLSTTADAQALGNLLVGFSKDPALVVSPIQINVEASTANWTLILGLELLNRITLNIVPRTGSSTTISQLLQSIEHNITPGQWTTTINGSVRFTNPFIIGTSLIGGTDLII
jgi:hypothetical protein